LATEAEDLALQGAFRLTAPTGEAGVAGPATIMVGAELLQVSPQSGDMVSVAYRDVDAVEDAGYEIVLSLADGFRLHLLRLGGRRDEALDTVRTRWRDALSAALFIAEPAEYDRCRSVTSLARGDLCVNGSAEVRIYDTRIGVFPDAGDPYVIEHAEVRGVSFDAAAYAVVIGLEPGDSLGLTRIGRRSKEWPGLLEKARSGVSARVRAIVGALFPSAPSGSGQTLFRNGFGARQADLAGSIPDFLGGLAALEGTEGRLAEYALALRALCPAAEARFGITLDTAKAFEGVGSVLPEVSIGEFESVRASAWALVPLASPKGTTAAAFEVLSAPDHATYGFRIDPACAGEELAFLEHCLRRIQFRRDPIAAEEDSLPSGVLRRVPQLRWLRERFIGRAVHSSVDTWTATVRAWA